MMPTDHLFPKGEATMRDSRERNRRTICLSARPRFDARMADNRTISQLEAEQQREAYKIKRGWQA